MTELRQTGFCSLFPRTKKIVKVTNGTDAKSSTSDFH
jgi:hypothetical protein